jgi:carbon starvation protein CstA
MPGTATTPSSTPGTTATPATVTTPGTTTPPSAGATPITGLRRGAFLGYRWTLLAFLLAGAVQIFLAGLGVFRLQAQGLKAAGDTAFGPHMALGFSMGGLALLILIMALIARPGVRAIAGSAVLVLLTSMVQSLLAGLGDDHAVYGGLHALDGLLILSIAGYLYARARRQKI